MKSRKFYINLLLFLFATITLSSQQNQLDVEGHTIIRGKIDINHMDDTTSVIIGRNAAINSDFSSRKYSTYVGSNAGRNATGSNNSFFGNLAGYSNNIGGSNNFFGYKAGYQIEGSANSFFGGSVGSYIVEGDHNSFFGSATGLFQSTGSWNSYFGAEAGYGYFNGNRNTYIGAKSGTYSDSLDRSIAIGYWSKVKCSRCAVIGGTGNNAVRLGIGVDTPTVVLTLLEPGADNPVGITQNQVGLGSTMEMTTTDIDGDQATRILLRGDNDKSDIEFYTGARGAELVSLFIEGTNRHVGINTNSPSEFLDVNGNARIRTVGSGAFKYGLNLAVNGVLTTDTSDERLKENISTMSNALEKTLMLRGVNYNWKSDVSKEPRIGLIAQEVEKVVPEVVFTNDADGYMGIRYQEIVALLIEGMKEQQLQINELSERLSELDKLLQEKNVIITTLKAQTK